MAASRLEVGAERSVIGLQKGRSCRPSHTGLRSTRSSRSPPCSRGQRRVGTVWVRYIIRQARLRIGTRLFMQARRIDSETQSIRPIILNDFCKIFTSWAIIRKPRVQISCCFWSSRQDATKLACTCSSLTLIWRGLALFDVDIAARAFLSAAKR